MRETTSVFCMLSVFACAIRVQVRGFGVINYVISISHGWGGTSLHVRTCTPHLRIRLTDCAKI